jgi:dTDP-4-amino-4,6-dideoxygalactose transaminase
MKIDFLDLYHINGKFEEELTDAFRQSLNESSFIGGENVKSFEKAFAQFCDVNHCLGVANGTDALEIIVEALELPVGSEVVVPANSFIATAEAVVRNGLKVKFCDVDPDTMNLSSEKLAQVISDKTSCVIFVHLYGNSRGIGGVSEFCHNHGLTLIEDCAQAHGATEHGKQAGSTGHASAFSFYPGKLLGALGDGGAVLSNDDKFIETCRKIANHGRVAKYDHEIIGRNSRLDSLQAKFLHVKLKGLDAEIESRRQIAERYILQLQEANNVELRHLLNTTDHAYHLFPIIVKDSSRDALKEFLHTHGVETGIHYPTLLPKTTAFQIEWSHDDVSSQLLSLPIGSHLTQGDVDCVCELICKFYE